MSERDDGGPAYPNTVKVTDEEYAELRGMSLRDRFAIAALPALIPIVHANSGSIGSDQGMANAADVAYGLADAMLKARKS